MTRLFLELIRRTLVSALRRRRSGSTALPRELEIWCRLFIVTRASLALPILVHRSQGIVSPSSSESGAERIPHGHWTP